MKNLPYDRHVLVCNGERCNRGNTAHKIRVHFKQLVQLEGLNVRTSFTSCMGLCEFAPTAVVYPDATVYCRITSQDVPEIVEEHLQENRPVDHLLLPPDAKTNNSPD